MDWWEACAAIANRARESDELQLLWEALDDAKDAAAAAKLIRNAHETTAGMITMLDEWVETAEDDGEPEEETPTA